MSRPDASSAGLLSDDRTPAAGLYDLLEKTRKAVLDLPSTVFAGSGDALHLACAEENGFQEVYTNDRHMLQAAKHFHVTGVNVLSENG